MLNTIVYFSSTTNNTHRFVEKLDITDTVRIPIKVNHENMPVMDRPYCLICPTYGGGATLLNDENSTRPVPPQVRKFFGIKENRENLVAVIASGNLNFGAEYALSGDVIAKKFGLPSVLYRFEMMGMPHDVEAVNKGLAEFTWVDRNGVQRGLVDESLGSRENT